MLLSLVMGILGCGHAFAQSRIQIYEPEATDLVGAPGSLIRAETIGGAPDGAQGWRIVYRSLDPHGAPIAVSGMVIVPAGAAPAGGRPIIAWAHPTTGVVPPCAPSLSPLRYMMIPGLRAMVRHGYIVAVTDYPGLGTNQGHPFLVGASEGQAVLDAVRASRALTGAGASDHFALWGHSQGGQAALFAAEMASNYAPELHLVGVAVAAPATDLSALLRADLGTKGGNNLASLALWSWSRGLGASYTDVVTPAAIPAIDTIAHQCIDRLFTSSAKRQADTVLAQSFFTVPDITAIEPWKSIIAKNTPGVIPPGIPVFLVQGSADQIVHPDITVRYAQTLCRNGNPTSLMMMQGVSHGWIAVKASLAAVGWMNSRFDGEIPPDNCREISSENPDSFA
jgi:acetyl esterase/lipase